MMSFEGPLTSRMRGFLSVPPTEKLIKPLFKCKQFTLTLCRRPSVSIQKALFEQAERIARKMKISRSRLFSLALEDYIRREQNRELLTQINAAYANEPDSTEKTLLLKSRATHRRIVKGEW
jgi:hypothetical protein